MKEPEWLSELLQSDALPSCSLLPQARTTFRQLHNKLFHLRETNVLRKEEL